MANYSLMWGRKCPGHLIYLIDQSGSMSGENEKKAADAVTSAITETFIGCKQGTEIRNRVYITIIGYGNEQGVSIIREGWMTDFVADLKTCRETGKPIIEPKAYGMTPMTEAFEKAKQCLETWIKAREAKCATDPHAGIPAPIVINITDGYPDDMVSAKKAAQDIMNIATPDGNVLLFNIHMDDSADNVEIRFPNDRALLNGVEAGEFLFDISSEMTDQFIESARHQHFEGIFPHSKGFVVNAKGNTLVRFVVFGSGVSGISQH